MMVIFRAVVNQSETTPRICPIDASAIAQPGSLYKVDLGTRLQIQFMSCVQGQWGLSKEMSRRQVEWRPELMRTELL